MRALSAAPVLLALGLAACGGGGGTPSPLPSPSPSAVRTVLETRSVTIAAGSVLAFNIDDVRAGVIDLRLDWQDASKDLNLFVTDLDCTSFLDLAAGRCRVLAQGAGSAKPEVASFTTTVTGTYRVHAQNASGAPEPVTLEIGLTR